MTISSRLVLTLCLLTVALVTFGAGQALDPSDRVAVLKAYNEGQYKEAHDALRSRALELEENRFRVDDLRLAADCLRRLNRIAELDALLEAAVEAHGDDWRTLWATAELYRSARKYGHIVAGEFQRGRHRGRAKRVHTAQRDRTRALQLYLRAEAAALSADAPAADLSTFYLGWAGSLKTSEAWRLQILTDLSELPDYTEGWYYERQQSAPVDADGNPIYYRAPDAWDAAENDGERWRWTLARAAKLDPNRTDAVRVNLADFFLSQFGVQTMAHYGLSQDPEDDSGPFAVHTLSDDETIAKLANGVRRFELPDEFNPLKIFRSVRDDGTDATTQAMAADRVASIYENRRQYPKAAAAWRLAMEFGKNDYRTQRLDSIVGNWGGFLGTAKTIAGQPIEFEYRFRNATEVQFTVYEVKVDKLLTDVKAYLEKGPERVQWQKINLSNIGYRLVHQNEEEYRGEAVATWTEALKPFRDHFDRTITVKSPVDQAGAYLIQGKVTDGNQSFCIVWCHDLAIVERPLDGEFMYYVADAVTGKPIEKANLEFFGYRQDRSPTGKYDVKTRKFAEYSNADGMVFQTSETLPNRWNWLVTARKGERLAYIGFDGVWYRQIQRTVHERVRDYVVTDRPVYRPNQTVNFHAWYRTARYDLDQGSKFAGERLTIQIVDPGGELIHEESRVADAYGGAGGTWSIPADAKLGTYHVKIAGSYGVAFRIEEYKKPEFEVSVAAPEKPVELGETFEIGVNAKYYFGAPVAEGTVTYKVERTQEDVRFYPYSRWDWLYGSGYWWFSYDYDWYPGWSKWGCRRPSPWWWGGSFQPPELVAEGTAELQPDGTFSISIDTALAKEVHGETSHRYRVTAEVTDRSRRTITGTGSVMVAHEPFRVFAWLDRGHYRVGDTVEANFSARTSGGQPVTGAGVLKLYRIQYEAGKPNETLVNEWVIDPDAEGRAKHTMEADRAGQYRVAYTVTDGEGRAREGGTVFVVRGGETDPDDFRFNALELVQDKREYAPGEKVQLLVNTDRPNSVVLLFVRPEGGVYPRPLVLRLNGKTAEEAIEVLRADMPNFFVEAFTVADGEVHTQAREIVVPPESRVLDVAVAPSAAEVGPGDSASVEVTLTDPNGEPFVGSTVISIYDKSVEAISGGPNASDIREAFWKWRRRHNPRLEHNLHYWSGDLVESGVIGRQDIGVFGGLDGNWDTDTAVVRESARSGGKRRMTKSSALRSRDAPASAAPMELSDTLQGFSGSDDADAEGGAPLVEAEVRSEFADTALWVAALETGPDGKATVSVDMPENLTTWKVRVWAMGQGTKVGMGESEIITTKNLLVRMQAPRFFTETDEVVLSANVHNYLETAKRVKVSLALDGPTLEFIGTDLERWVEVEPNGEARVDWRVRVAREGEAIVRMLALSDEESDAMEQRFPVHVHGMTRTESFSGVIRPDGDHGAITFEVPAERRVDETRLELRYSPTLAGAMVDALPYLIDYPYGCTEQTLNRFLPAAITQKVLRDMGVDLAAIRDKRTNLNAQEIGDDRARAEGWKRYNANPVFDEAELSKIVKAGVERLTNMQLSDGGWGWFSGWGERSSAHTTATVVRGLIVARENDVAIVPGVLESGIAWLSRYQSEQIVRLNNAASKTRPYKTSADNLDAYVYMILAQSGSSNAEMRDYLYRDRTNLSPYALALYGVGLDAAGETEKRDMVVRNVSQFEVEDDENQTLYLNLPGGGWWYWYGNEYEAHAAYLKLLCKVDPKGRKASRLVKYLLNNRKNSTYWRSTRDTALCVEAMADFLRASGEDAPDMTVEVWLDGAKRKEVRITASDLFAFDNKFVLEGAAVTSGEHTLELRRKGSGPLYFNAYLSTFTLERHIEAAGLELKVERQVYKLEPEEASVDVRGGGGRAVSQKVEKYRRVLLADGDQLESGDLIEIELKIDSKNDYEYLIFEDFKGAGFEPVEVRSGYNGNDLGAYVEFRDRKVCFFTRRLARGTSSVSYRLRAEIPGVFAALPTVGYAMYAPELRGNSEEVRLKIVDGE